MPHIRSVALLTLLALGAACDAGEAGSSAPPPAVADSLAPAGEWVTVLERTMAGKRPRPERFETHTDSLRVITTMEASVSPYSPGLVVTNLLSDATTLPVASIRAEQRRLDTTTADTTVVEVASGPLYFFVAEHRGLTDWTVTLQEFRPSSSVAEPAG